MLQVWKKSNPSQDSQLPGLFETSLFKLSDYTTGEISMAPTGISTAHKSLQASQLPSEKAPYHNVPGHCCTTFLLSLGHTAISFPHASLTTGPSLRHQRLRCCETSTGILHNLGATCRYRCYSILTSRLIGAFHYLYDTITGYNNLVRQISRLQVVLSSQTRTSIRFMAKHAKRPL